MSMVSIDAERLRAWFDGEGIEPGRSLSIKPMPGGTSNEMFLVRRGAGHWVLRRPAKVAIDGANEGMRREFHILASLARTSVPHPTAVALCDDPEVLGCAFYLMEYVEGVNPIPVPAAFDNDHGRAEIAYAMVDALASVHEVNYRAVGLGDLGHPNGFHERQVGRWSRQLASYEGRQIPGIVRIMNWLDSNRPVEFSPALMHGDFHMRNALISTRSPTRVVAILDWETATIGDPLLDLAGFCEIWCPIANTGWPSRSELISHYQTRRGIEILVPLEYYEVLYNFRLAVLVEGIYQRSLRDASRLSQADMGELAIRSVSRATQIISGSSVC